MSLVIVEGAILLCFGESRIMLDWLRAPEPGLVFEGIKDFVDGESQTK